RSSAFASISCSFGLFVLMYCTALTTSSNAAESSTAEIRLSSIAIWSTTVSHLVHPNSPLLTHTDLFDSLNDQRGPNRYTAQYITAARVSSEPLANMP